MEQQAQDIGYLIQGMIKDTLKVDDGTVTKFIYLDVPETDSNETFVVVVKKVPKVETDPAYSFSI